VLVSSVVSTDASDPPMISSASASGFLPTPPHDDAVASG
jgi:hypothetical protein